MACHRFWGTLLGLLIAPNISVMESRPREARVVISVRTDNVYFREDSVPFAVKLSRAELTAIQIFGEIGVQVVWHASGKYPSKSGGALIIEVQLEASKSENSHPGALAYAAPFAISGTSIHVLYDRVLRSASAEFAGVLLGHVMAHEIAHVLERSDRHSVEGVMKAQWGPQDYHDMFHHPLTFDAIDSELIHATLEQVAARVRPGGR